MKTLLPLLGLALGLVNLPAQEKQTVTSKPATQSSEKKPGPAIETPKPKPAVKVGEVPARVGGFVGETAAQKRSFLKSINPFDPTNPGPDGRNVSTDPLTGRAVGFKLVTIEF
jgi:hypothetical protein